MNAFSFDDIAFVGGRLLSYPAYVQDYLDRVTAADVAAGNTSGLEMGVTDAASTFLQDLVSISYLGVSNNVISQEASVIKASCIMAGARTLAGALVPLVGAAPTNNNFVSGDYDRKTGLVGDGETKNLDSNYSASNLGINNNHISFYKSTLDDRSVSAYIAATLRDSINALLGIYRFSGADWSFNQSNISAFFGLNSTGFGGMSRSNASSYQVRKANVTANRTITSQYSANTNFIIFGSPNMNEYNSNARIAFYSIGEALDLALLEARVTALISAIGAAF